MSAAPKATGVFEPEYTDALIEIRARSGDKEAEVFAAELLQMYTNFAHDQGWSTEVVLRQETNHQHMKMALLKVIGKGDYSKLREETGWHRVQRVPASERQGRIHTAAVSVTVMPVPGEHFALEKIRTYNFQEDEVRDHRHKVSVPGVRRILGGRLDLLLDKLHGDSWNAES